MVAARIRVPQVSGRRVGIKGLAGRPHETNWDRFVNQTADEDYAHVYSAAVEEMERHVLTLVLRKTGGNQSEAARILGISRFSLRKKLARLHLNVQWFIPQSVH